MRKLRHEYAHSPQIWRLLAVLLLAACGGPHAREQRGGRRAQVSFSIKGSDTMVILTQVLAGAYMDAHSEAALSVSGGGSGTGIAALLNGTAEIATSSRPVQPREQAQLAPLSLHEHRIAIDALAVYVHQRNPLASITMEELKAVYRGQIESFDVLTNNPSTNSEREHHPIVLYSRENNSGTYVYFKEHVLERQDFAAEAQMMPGTAAVINAVAHDRNGIGYGGIGFASGVRLVPIRATVSAPAVTPNLRTASDGSYPLSRFLYMYTTSRTSPAALEFVRWVLSAQGQARIEESGFYPLAGPHHE